MSTVSTELDFNEVIDISMFDDEEELALSQQENPFEALQKAAENDKGTSQALPIYSKALYEAKSEVMATAIKAFRANKAVGKLQEDLKDGVFPVSIDKGVNVKIDHQCDTKHNDLLNQLVSNFKTEATKIVIASKVETITVARARCSNTGPISVKLYKTIKDIEKQENIRNPTGAAALAKETEGILTNWADAGREAAYKEGLEKGSKELETRNAKKAAEPSKSAAKPKPKPTESKGKRPQVDRKVRSNYKQSYDQPLTSLGTATQTTALCTVQRKGQGKQQGQRTQLKVNIVLNHRKPTRRMTCANKRALREKQRANKFQINLSNEQLFNLRTVGVGKLAVHILDNVFNYREASALAMGHRFIPTPKYNTKIITESFTAFRKRMRWAWFFRHKQDRPKPNWYIPTGTDAPAKYHNPQLESLLDSLHSKLLAAPARSNKTNWPQYMQKRLSNLLADSTRLVILTDKNLGYAIVSTEWYKAQILAHLEDEHNYKLVEEDHESIIVNAKTSVTQLASCYRGILTSLEYEWITQEQDARIMPFYITAKVHKTPWAGRPITPSWCWPTFHLSEILAQELQPIVNKSTIVLRDSKQLLHILNNRTFEYPIENSKQLFLLTADVTALYPNIDTQRGVKAIRAILSSMRQYQSPRGHGRMNFICESLSYVLQANFVHALGHTYQQINGTAMGTPLAPPYANLFLHHLEHPTISKWIKRHCILLYKRYIDDVFCIFHGTKKELAKFQSNMNSLDPSIKLTWEMDTTTVNFLDITIFRNDSFLLTRKLQTKVFQKALNEYLYLPKHSYHTRDMKKGFIKGEAIRYVRGCSQLKDYQSLLQQFRKRLLIRGYSLTFINDAIANVKYTDRTYYLQDNPKSHLPKLLYKTELNPAVDLKHTRKLLAKFSNSLKGIPDITEHLCEHITLCQKVPPKLHDSINRARNVALSKIA
jgi:hypothetical protein